MMGTEFKVPKEFDVIAALRKEKPARVTRTGFS